MTNKIKIIWQIVDFITTLPLLGKINYFLFSIHLQYCLVILGGSGLVTKSCPTFACRIKVTCSLPGSSVHGILQARILDWVAISFSKGSSWLTNWTRISCTAGRFFTDLAAAAAAKSLQSCPTLCDPIDSSPPGSPIPGILQARTLEWLAISYSNAWKWKVKGKSLSRVQLFATPWTAAHQALPSMGFSRQEYWSGVPSPSPTDWATSWQLLLVTIIHT